MQQDILIQQVLEGRQFIFEPEPYYGGSTLWIAYQGDLWYLMERHLDLPWVIRYPCEPETFERVRRGWQAFCSPLEAADPRLQRAYRAIVDARTVNQRLQEGAGAIELQQGTHYIMYHPVGGVFQLIAADPPNLSLLFAPLPMLIRRLWHHPEAKVAPLPAPWEAHAASVLERLTTHVEAIDSGLRGLGPIGGESIAFLFRLDGRYLDVLLTEQGTLSEQTLHNPYSRVVPRRTVIARVLDELQSLRPRRCLQDFPRSIEPDIGRLRQALTRSHAERLEACMDKIRRGEWISLGSAGGEGVSLGRQGERYVRRGELASEMGRQEPAGDLSEEEVRQLLDTWLRLGLHPEAQ